MPTQQLRKMRLTDDDESVLEAAVRLFGENSGIDWSTFCPTVFDLVRTSDGRFGIGRQATPLHDWGFVQGSIESFDENDLAAGFRELYEETGIRPDSVVSCKRRLFLDVCDCTRNPRMRGAVYAGHLFQLAPDVDVDLVRASHGHELHEWRWGTVFEVSRLLSDQPGAHLAAHPRHAASVKQKVQQIFLPALEQAALIGELDDL